MLKIITANLNGIRSASTKGFLEWMVAQDAGADLTKIDGYGKTAAEPSEAK